MSEMCAWSWAAMYCGDPASEPQLLELITAEQVGCTSICSSFRHKSDETRMVRLSNGSVCIDKGSSSLAFLFYE
jgi:hypothetical protein